MTTGYFTIVQMRTLKECLDLYMRHDDRHRFNENGVNGKQICIIFCDTTFVSCKKNQHILFDMLS